MGKHICIENTIACFALKHNGDISKHFHNQRIVFDSADVIVLYADKGTRVDNVTRGTHWITHYAAYKILPKHDWYNIIIVEKENGLEYYCNLASPPIIEASRVSYIDYDIDVVRTPEGEIIVFDIDEFHERIGVYSYPDEIVKRVLEMQTSIEKALSASTGYMRPDFYQSLKIRAAMMG